MNSKFQKIEKNPNFFLPKNSKVYYFRYFIISYGGQWNAWYKNKN